MNRGLSMEWEVRELFGLWLQQLFSLFSGYHARNLAIILSHLNVIFFHIYSNISAVFLTMALLFRCLLAYRLGKKRRLSACSSWFFLLAPTFISFKHQWQSDWAVFSNDAASRRLRAQPSVQSRGGGHTVLSLHVPPKVYGGYAHGWAFGCPHTLPHRPAVNNLSITDCEPLVRRLVLAPYSAIRLGIHPR